MKAYLKNLNRSFFILPLFFFNIMFSQSQRGVKLKLDVYESPCVTCDFAIVIKDTIVFKGKTDQWGYALLHDTIAYAYDKVTLDLGGFSSSVNRSNAILKEDFTYFNFTDIAEDVLEEIVIFAAKNIIEDYGYKTVYNVDKDRSIAAVSAADLLRRVPGISVGFDGTPSIRGSVNIQVKVNNKIIRNADPKTVLSSIPPIDIVKIEVVLSPSIKDSSSAEYILHIVTKNSVYVNKSGYINLGLGDKGSHLFSNYNTLISKNMLLTQSFSSLTYTNNTEFKNLLNDVLTLGAGESKGFLYNYNANLTFLLKNKSSFDFSFRFLNQDIKNKESYTTKDTLGRYYSKNNSSYSNVVFSYNSKKELSNLELSYDFGWIPLFFRSENESVYHYKSNNKTAIFSSNIKLDYAYKFSRKYEVETGAHFQYDEIKGKSVIENLNFNAEKMVSNIYLNNLINLSPFSFELGVGFNTYSYLWRDHNIGRNGLFYSLKGNYKKDIANTFYFSYNKSFINPNNSYVLPISSLISPVILQKGNPHLYPVVSNKFELGYSNKSDAFFLKASPFFVYNKRVINTVLSDNSMSYLNSGNYYAVGVSNWITSNLLNKKLAVNYGMDFFYKHIKYDLNHNKGFQIKNNLHLSFKFNKSIDIQFFGNFNSPEILLYGKENNFTYSNFSIQKKVFDNKAILAFSIDNPFSRGFRYTNEIDNRSDIYKKEIFYKNRGIRLFFSYQFGNNNTNQKDLKNSNDFRTF
ncbi:TonB-dependent siderophore receptor [Flavobacterium sp. NKUCC04_CG]|uniref:TonB-dependent receptor plug domain-containing protein n=1 Tax=Flavobacterium sp. NKUCC04_CG TaxID=2842121 RepID=UPI001C5B020C|nr:TonB-dependent receptor [Flavobacterium sp. NKUCC04_CG]MBW3518079.1 outer membrane beta-barrel protein [Flavobacterium sp. NKUCC04_CG]